MSSGNNFPPQPPGAPFGGDSGWTQADGGADQYGAPQPHAYDPSAGQGYDPNAAQGYDPNAAQGYDPNAAQGYGYDQGFGQEPQQYGQDPQYGQTAQYGQAAYGSGSAAYSASGPDPSYAGATPQPAPAPGFVAQQTAPTKKKSKMPLILSLVAVGVVVLLVVVGAVVITSVNRSQYGPDKVAEDYLTALQTGDIAAANEIAAPVVPNGANETLLDPAYVGAADEKMTGATITSTTIDGSTATIEANYSVGGQVHDLVLNARKDGRQGLFFDNWVLTAPTLQTIAIEMPALEGVTINGQDIDPQQGRTEYAVFPGSYRVVTPEGTFFEAADDQVTVGFSPTEQPQAATLNLDVSPKASFGEEVQRLVDEKIEECGKNKTIANEGCPFNVSSAVDRATGTKITDDGVEDSVKYNVTRTPTVQATMSSDLSAGSFYTTTSGAFTFTADSKGFGAGAWQSIGSIDIEASGIVNIDGDSLSIEFF